LDEINYVNHYERKFRRQVGKIGDATPSYCFLKKEVIELVREYNPKMRMIYTLRNPIYRVYSHIRHLTVYRRGHKNTLTQAKNLTPNELQEIIDSSAMKLSSDYVGNITRWWEVFGKRQLLILKYDLLKNYPKKFLNKIVRHLRADPRKINYKFLGTWFCPGFKGLRNAIGPTGEIPRNHLEQLREYYRNHIEELSSFLGEDLSYWLEE